MGIGDWGLGIGDYRLYARGDGRQRPRVLFQDGNRRGPHLLSEPSDHHPVRSDDHDRRLRQIVRRIRLRVHDEGPRGRYRQPVRDRVQRGLRLGVQQLQVRAPAGKEPIQNFGSKVRRAPFPRTSHSISSSFTPSSSTHPFPSQGVGASAPPMTRPPTNTV